MRRLNIIFGCAEDKYLEDDDSDDYNDDCNEEDEEGGGCLKLEREKDDGEDNDN